MSEEYEKQMDWEDVNTHIEDETDKSGNKFSFRRLSEEMTEFFLLKTRELKIIKKVKGNKSKVTLIRKESSIRDFKNKHVEQNEPLNPSTPASQKRDQVKTSSPLLPQNVPVKTPSYQRNLLAQKHDKENTITQEKEVMEKPNLSLNLNISDVKVRRKSEKFKKSKFTSQVSFMRHRQSVNTMKMFSVVVAVFATLALPHQLSWFLKDFSNLPILVEYSFTMLTFGSKILNCWIYSWFNRDIRRAYINILFRWCVKKTKEGTIPSIVIEQPPHSPHSPSPHSPHSPHTPHSPSLYTERKESLFHDRKVLFDLMINEHFERARRSLNNNSLYSVKDEEESVDESYM